MRAQQFSEAGADCVDLASGYFRKNFIGYIKIIFFLPINFFRLYKKRDFYAKVIIVKPWSILIALSLGLIFQRRKVFLDINDPLHLPEFLGESRFKLFLFFFRNNLIFESEEYYKYCKKKYHVEGRIIEDYAQIEDIPEVEWAKKEKQLLWYGDKKISEILVEYASALNAFQNAGYCIKTIGASDHVIAFLKKRGLCIDILKPKSRDDFLSILAKSRFVIAPFNPDLPLHTMRGNLKVKIAMASGACVVAEDMAMHRRLVQDSINGFLINKKTSIEEIDSRIVNCINLANISENARKSIKTLGDRRKSFNKYKNA